VVRGQARRRYWQETDSITDSMTDQQQALQEKMRMSPQQKAIQEKMGIAFIVTAGVGMTGMKLQQFGYVTYIDPKTVVLAVVSILWMLSVILNRHGAQASQNSDDQTRAGKKTD